MAPGSELDLGLPHVSFILLGPVTSYGKFFSWHVAEAKDSKPNAQAHLYLTHVVSALAKSMTQPSVRGQRNSVFPVKL